MSASDNGRLAAQYNDNGLQSFAAWEIERAIDAFQQAVSAAPDNAEYHLNLARAYARSSEYHQAINALGNYLRVETDEAIASRYERLFSSALDEVETELIDKMQKMEASTQNIGKAIQMWLEYRITVGRQPLVIDVPALWAGALTYAISKVNFIGMKGIKIARTYNVDEADMKAHYRQLVQTLDLMPADYRYFTGENNPLDKLVEAAAVLEDLDRRFQADD